MQKIKRFQVGTVSLGDLQSGESRALSKEEMKQLMNQMVHMKFLKHGFYLLVHLKMTGPQKLVHQEMN